ncbi:MAG: hypothetical protein HKN33_16915 [Pyrinomonadaceae bacterium]|nr:hypothetical protein [Pyrinomonadaceae bacterium]
MKYVFCICLCLIALSFGVVSAQDVPQNPKVASVPETLAKKAFEAHGGEKLKSMSTLTMSGSVDVTSSAANQAIPAKFLQVFSGEKYRLEIDGGFVQFVQIFDGVNTVTSPSRGFTLPPINRVGLMLLQRYGDEGFEITETEEKQKNGFRMSSPEGYYTDFILNKKSGRVKSYNSSYFVGGREVTTLVEVDKYSDYEGIIIPTKYAQKFDVSGMTIYAVFKSKTVEVNGEVADELFLSGE